MVRSIGSRKMRAFMYTFSNSRNLRMASWGGLSSPPLNRGFLGRLESLPHKTEWLRFYYILSQPHSWTDPGQVDTVVVWVISPPTF